MNIAMGRRKAAGQGARAANSPGFAAEAREGA